MWFNQDFRKLYKKLKVLCSFSMASIPFWYLRVAKRRANLTNHKLGYKICEISLDQSNLGSAVKLCVTCYVTNIFLKNVFVVYSFVTCSITGQHCQMLWQPIAGVVWSLSHTFLWTWNSQEDNFLRVSQLLQNRAFLFYKMVIYHPTNLVGRWIHGPISF